MAGAHQDLPPVAGRPAAAEMTQQKAEAIARGDDTFSTTYPTVVLQPISYPRPYRVVMVVMGFLLLLIIGIVAALILVNNAQNKADENAVERDRGRVVACAYYNVDQLRLRTALKDSLRALIPAGTPLTSEQTVALAAYNATVDRSTSYRDCSPAGIEVFYANPPVDPAGGG